MFQNLNVWEVGALLLVALLIFGDKLPNVINDGLRMLRNLRRMATSATSDLGKELGTDIQLSDLHPKTFIRKHVLSEEDEAALRRPLESLREDIQNDLKGVQTELNDVAENVNSSASSQVTSAESSGPESSGAAKPAATRTFDFDAT
jgi:sec-independent protein translocase protein TatB